MATISIIMPVLNEEIALSETLDALQALRQVDCELIVVDGGSDDASVAVATPLVDRMLTAPRGRAIQMNAGAAAATGEVLWFLHADVRPPRDALVLIRAALAQGFAWGRFDIDLSGKARLLRVVETMMNWRSRWSGIATGDQGIFVTRALFQAVGDYPAVPLMEDIALCRTLRRRERPACLAARLLVSSRRWEQRGIAPTIGLMWWLRLAYFLGVSPERLARSYHGY